MKVLKFYGKGKKVTAMLHYVYNFQIYIRLEFKYE